MNLVIKKQDNIIVSSHPLISDNLAVVRDKNTPSELFRNSVKRISQELFYKATENLPVSVRTIETPLMKTDVAVIDQTSEIIIAPILRAGLIFSDVFLAMLPDAKVHHIGLYRDEKTLQPVAYYNNLPEQFKNPEKTYIYISDPMLATGGSAIEAIKLFVEKGVPQENITFISLISAPEGVNNLLDVYSDIRIITASVDTGLDKNGYIFPGLGDAGDRTFNTI